MKFVFIALLMFAVPTAFGFSCKVSCPSGYNGSCVGNAKDGCNCSCDKSGKNAKIHIIKALQEAGASVEFQEKVSHLLGNAEEFSEQSLTDEKTGKQFSIMLTKADSSPNR